MLFQNNALFDYMTVGENIAFPLRRLFDLPEDEIARARRRAARAWCACRASRSACPRASRAARRSASASRAPRSRRREIVLYDEPAAGLDPVTSQRIFELLRAEQRAAGATVIMVSSDLDRLLTVTDRVGMLYRGQAHLRRHHRGGAGEHRPARAAVRPRPHRGPALSGRGVRARNRASVDARQIGEALAPARRRPPGTPTPRPSDG